MSKKKSKTKYLTKKEYIALEKANVEKKAYDVTSAGVNVLDTGNAIALSAIGEGPSIDDRIGQKIKAVGLRAKFQIQRTSVDAFVRVVIFQYHRPVPGSNPGQTDILTTANSIRAPTLFGSGSYTIMMDKMFPTLTSEEPIRIIDKYFKLNRELQWASNTANSWSKGPFFCFVFSDVSAGYPTMSYQFRLTFTDS